jgi:hypothetical protein
MTTEVPQKLHRDIMRSVKIVKRRYYLFGLLTGFFASLVAMLWVVYMRMVEIGSFDFFTVLAETLQIDPTLVSDFKEDIVEFLPLDSLGWSLALLIIVSFFVGLIFRYKKVLFLKVDKFSK